MKFRYRIILRFWNEKSSNRSYSYEIYHSEIFEDGFMMRPLSAKVEPIRERATFPELFKDVKIIQDDSRTSPISTLCDFIEFSEIAEQLLENDLKEHITETPRCFEVYGEAEYNFDGDYDYSDQVIVTTAHCQEVNDDDADRIFN